MLHKHMTIEFLIGTVVTLNGRIYTDNVDDVEEESHISRWVHTYMHMLIYL